MPDKVNRTLLVGQIAGEIVVFAAVLFLSAGTIAWPAGWAFLILFSGFVVSLGLWLLRHNPGLLVERMTGIGRADQKAWDKLMLLLALVIVVARRAVLEERTLREELPGYDLYMARVRSRLIPYVW